MTDLSKTILAKSDQLNADDLISGSMDILITKVSAGTVEQPIAINYEGDNGKPYYPCKSMRRVLVYLWGADGLAYVGRNLRLYRDPEVKFGGIKVGGIRISHMSHIEKEATLSLTAAKASKKPFTVKPLTGTAAPKTAKPSAEERKEAAEKKAKAIISQLEKADSVDAVQAVWDEHKDVLARLSDGYNELYQSITLAYEERLELLDTKELDDELPI